MKDVTPSEDGIPIAFEVDGTRSPTLVFVHGWSCDRTYWRGQMGPLVERYRVVAIDLPGHGESGVGRPTWTMAAFGADVAAVVDRLRLDDVVLVGHSMGGDVILEAVPLLGDRLIGVVWVDVYRALGQPDSPEEVEAFIEPFRQDFVGRASHFIRDMVGPTADPALADWIVSDMASAPRDIALDTLEHAVSNEPAAVAALDRLAVPIVEINPDYRPTDAGSLIRHRVRPVILSSVGHFLMLEDPDQFNRALDDVVAGFVRPT